MKKSPLHLTASDYVANDRNGLNQQIANARWFFLKSVQRCVPEFFEHLREQVYPAYAQVEKTGYWRTGFTFRMWQSRSDKDHFLTPILTRWARQFHLEQETWILEGALQTLSNWHRFPHTREKREMDGFRKPICVSGLVLPNEQAFRFEEAGWDPTLISFAGWRMNLRPQIEKAMREYRQRMVALVDQRGGTPSKALLNRDHFEWLALYQCGGLSLESVAKRTRHADKTTISKGLHQAAELARIHVRGKRAS